MTDALVLTCIGLVVLLAWQWLGPLDAYRREVLRTRGFLPCGCCNGERHWWRPEETLTRTPFGWWRTKR